MVEQIYQNNFTNKFINQEIEKDFQIMRDKKLLTYNKFILIFSLIYGLGISIYNSFFLEYFDSNMMFSFDVITVYFSTIVYIIFMILGWSSKNTMLLRWIHYFIFYLQLFIAIGFRFTMIRISKVDISILFFMFLIDIVLRLTWVLLFIQTFIESFLLNMFSIFTIWLTIPFLFPADYYNTAMTNFSSYSCSILVVIGFSYILSRQQKKGFYFNWVADTKANWLTSVFENMNTGFISIKGEKISYINSFMLNQFKKIRNVIRENKENQILRPEICYLDTQNGMLNEPCRINVNYPNLEEDNNYLILYLLLNQMKTDSLSKIIIYYIYYISDNPHVKNIISTFLQDISNNNIQSENSVKTFLPIFIQYVKKIPNIENFISIGDNTIEIDKSEIHFEIQCRYFNSGNEDELEILFNDVTRTKSYEIQNAEFKYKTLFLNKIAHEFKNPLICITELINQFYDQSTNSEEEIKIKKILDQIKSLSNFLLILAKDLNYFSEFQMGKDIYLDMKDTDLNEIINFSKDITMSLLKKSNKKNSIKLFVNVKKDLPKIIFTDEWRIKQVLINLLSNAIKFTLYGQIVFDVSLEVLNEQTYIKFLVEDTGVGIKKEFFNTLFKPFNKNIKKNNELGSGLGLSIASEICGKISNGLDFESTPGKGSKFWFYILLNNFNKQSPNNSDSINIPKRKKSNLSSKYQLSFGSINESIETKQLNDHPLIKNFNFQEDINNVHINNDSDIDVEIISNQVFSNRNNVNSINTLMLNKTYLEDNKKVKINYLIFQFHKIVKNEECCIFEKNNETSMTHKSKEYHNVYKFTVNDFLLNDTSKMRKTENINVYNLNINNFNYNPNVNDFKISGSDQIAGRNFINVIVTDDEVFTRQSTVRILHNISNELNIKINIIEAEDGLETIYLIYKAAIQGIRISMIFSDENMNFINGTRSSEIILEILERKRLVEIPFFLVTAYDNSLLKSKTNCNIKQVLSKPLSKEIAKNIILQLL